MRGYEARMLAMLIGWMMACYGVRRRSWSGTTIALSGLALAEGAMTVGRA
jgi:hypothetical protein